MPVSSALWLHHGPPPRTPPPGAITRHDQPHRSEPLHLPDCPLVTIAATTGPGPSTSPVAARVGLLNDGSGPLPHRPAGDSAGWRWQCGSALGQLCLTLPQEAVDKPVSLAHASGMHPPRVSPRTAPCVLGCGGQRRPPRTRPACLSLLPGPPLSSIFAPWALGPLGAHTLPSQAASFKGRPTMCQVRAGMEAVMLAQG